MIFRRLLGLTCVVFVGTACVPAWSDEFPAIYDTENPDAKVMSPAESLSTLRLPDGFHATMFAAEPDVRQPIGAAFDERGRLWVVECYTYAEGGRNFDTSLRDRVVILEDSDGDGVHDRRTVFWDQGTKLTSVEFGMGGVWLLGPPNLYFLADRNHDDVPDGPPEIVLDGWKETAIRHNIANGLKWGPDGWLYGRQGILETSPIGPPGATESQRVPINCGVWRYHPITKRVEAVLHGTTNPWGFDYDAHGEMFIINTVIGHLWHVVPGVHTERMFGADMNPRSYGLVGQVADHFHWDVGEPWHAIRKGSTDTTQAAGGGHAHSGLMIYQGDNWPAEERGKVFAINFHGRRLNRDRLERKASGFTARHEADQIFWTDEWFRGIDLLTGPDGGVYVLDWSDTGECHEENGIHRSSGRVYKIVYRAPAPTPAFNLRIEPLTDLVQTIHHANKWWPRQARRVLRDRRLEGEDVAGVVEDLKQAFRDESDSSTRLEAVWMLEAAGAVDEALFASILADPDEYVRGWGVRLTADRLSSSEYASFAAERIAKLAPAETSPLVQLYLASALQQLPVDRRWPLALELANKPNVSDDRTLALMIWYGIEPAIPRDVDRATALYNASKSPIIRRYIARRLTEELDRDSDMIDALLASASDSADAIAGMGEALQGWSQASAPGQFSAAVERLTAPQREALGQTLREIGVVFGDGRSMQELLALLPQDENVDVRRQAIRTIARTPSADALSALLPLVTNRDVQIDAIRALASFDDAAIPTTLIKVYATFPDGARESAVDTLVSRPGYARALLAAMKDQTIPRGAVSAFHARQIRSFDQQDLTDLLSSVWGEARTTSEQKAIAMKHYRETSLSADQLRQADLAGGRRLFQKQCAGCHVLFGEGRKLGPDLTGSQRKSLDYLLENLIDPSAVVAADFRAATVVLQDGRSIQGVVAGTSERTITLQTKDQDIVVDRMEIDEIVPTNLSLMPEGVLDQLSAHEVRDLVGYLMSDHQVSLNP